jgi:flagellar biosynthesis anti-sigma factor FlgM
MSGMIPPVQPGAIAPDANTSSAGGSAAVPAAAAPVAAVAGSAGAAEAVTLSAGASATTQLLEAARGSDGVDQGAVQRLRGAIQNGTYSVAPAALAKSIAGALRESST